MLFHPFFNKETKKLIDIFKFCLIWSSVILTFPIAVPRHNTFFNWNLTDDLPSSTLALTSSFELITVGNFPHLAKKFPPNLFNCLTKVSEMKKSLIFSANFFNSFPFLSAGSTFFFKASPSINSIPCCLHLSMWAASAITHTLSFSLGKCGSLTVALKRLRIMNIITYLCWYRSPLIQLAIQQSQPMFCLSFYFLKPEQCMISSYLWWFY